MYIAITLGLFQQSLITVQYSSIRSVAINLKATYIQLHYFQMIPEKNNQRVYHLDEHNYL